MAAIFDHEVTLRKEAICQGWWSRKEEVADEFVDVPGLTSNFCVFLSKEKDPIVYISNCNRVLTAEHNPLFITVCKAPANFQSGK